jgi:hypothetical protein
LILLCSRDVSYPIGIAKVQITIGGFLHISGWNSVVFECKVVYVDPCYSCVLIVDKLLELCVDEILVSLVSLEIFNILRKDGISDSLSIDGGLESCVCVVLSDSVLRVKRIGYINNSMCIGGNIAICRFLSAISAKCRELDGSRFYVLQCLIKVCDCKESRI